MSLQRELNLIRQMASIDVGTRVGVGDVYLRQIQMKALTKTANWTVNTIVRPLMAEPGPPFARSSPPGGPPKYRTGSLHDSIDTWPARASTKAPTVFAAVHPNAVDRSRGRRLQLYSRYLETGWTPGRKTGRAARYRVLPAGESGDTFEGPYWPSTAPRYYMKQIFIRNQVGRIQTKYQWEIRKLLPAASRPMANKFTLDVTYISPFSFGQFGVM